MLRGRNRRRGRAAHASDQWSEQFCPPGGDDPHSRLSAHDQTTIVEVSGIDTVVRDDFATDPASDKAHAIHQFRAIVPHIAHFGTNLPSLDFASIGLHHLHRLIGGGTHPVIELAVVGHDRHTVVVLLHARRGIRGDDGKAGDGATTVALPYVIDTSKREWLGLWLGVIRTLLLAFLVNLRPLVPAARRNQATALLEWLAIGGGRLDRLGPRVDRTVGLLGDGAGGGEVDEKGGGPRGGPLLSPIPRVDGAGRCCPWGFRGPDGRAVAA